MTKEQADKAGEVLGLAAVSITVVCSISVDVYAARILYDNGSPLMFFYVLSTFLLVVGATQWARQR